MTEAGAKGTYAERLRDARRSRFVGRERELTVFRELLSDARGGVLFLHGPGGVGKSTLIAAMRDAAEARGARPAMVDCRAVPTAPPALGEAVRAALERAGQPDEAVLFLDTYEHLAGLDDWVRDTLIPTLPANTLVVIAGRHGPGPGWHSDPGWQALLKTISLRNLEESDARRYLEGEGVPKGLCDALVRGTYGHPLALSLATELVRRGASAPSTFDLGTSPDVVRTLLGTLVDEIPSSIHRRALAVCAHARFTTEALLKAVVGEERGTELFEWLRGRSFVLEGPLGLFPHDLVRDLLEADARWRDPTAFRETHLAVYGHTAGCFLAAPEREQPRWLADVLFLNRNDPATAAHWDYEALASVYPDRLRSEDESAVVEITRRFEPMSVPLLEYWLARQREHFIVVRDTSGAVVGYGFRMALHETTSEDRAADPGARALWEHAHRNAPPRPGDEMAAWRFLMDGDGYQALGTRTWTGGVMAHSQRVLAQPRLAHEYNVYRDPEAMALAMAWAYCDRVPPADFEVEGTRFGVFLHDWRQLPHLEWIRKLAERSIGAGDPVQVGTRADPEVLVLSEPDFAGAVRQALKDAADPAKLRRSPLLRSRLVQDRRGDGTGEATLRRLLEQATRSLAAERRGDQFVRAVERTYLSPAPTQELAAEMLGMPFSTYRRHVKRGVEGIVRWLWRAELGEPTSENLPE